MRRRCSSRSIPALLAATALALAGSTACRVPQEPTESEPGLGEEAGTLQTVASTPTRARSSDGRYISWKEHLIDDVSLEGGIPLAGSDGLALGDLDRDGHVDVVSVHEADTTYDGVARGHIRVAFGSASPDRWELATLASGAEAGAAEDVAIGDVDGDGFPDVVAACELAHLLYLQNPGEDIRSVTWERVIPPGTTDRGSFIRVFLADLGGDARPEILAANKGAQNPSLDTSERDPISWFDPGEDPLAGDWTEHVLTRVPIPINSHPVDLDGDGDMDVVGGSRGERRIFWFENQSGREISFLEHPIELAGNVPSESDPRGRPPRAKGITGPIVTGFNLDFADLSGDGRLDVVLTEALSYLLWLEQPEDLSQAWTIHPIGDIRPDHLVGFRLADIDGDGRRDVIVGGYSAGPRDRDGEDMGVSDALGRLAWFQQPAEPGSPWIRHDISRRKRGMYDQFAARDMDGDGDVDFISTRGNSLPYDGVFWLEQVRTEEPVAVFDPARSQDSEQVPLPPM